MLSKTDDMTLIEHTHAKPERRTQRMRSEAARNKLMLAAIDVLLEKGYAGLTTAQVEARAGVSSGARVHHYPTKADLVIAATGYVYERAEELGQKRATAASLSAEPIRNFVKDCLTVYFDWPFIAALELTIIARTDPALMARLHPILEKFHQTMRKTWLEAFVKAGYERERAEVDLRLTLNLIRGMAINKVWESDTKEYRRLLDDWCARIAPKPGGAG